MDTDTRLGQLTKEDAALAAEDRRLSGARADIARRRREIVREMAGLGALQRDIAGRLQITQGRVSQLLKEPAPEG